MISDLVNRGFGGRVSGGFYNPETVESYKQKLLHSYLGGGEQGPTPREEHQAEYEYLIEKLTDAIRRYEGATNPADQAMLNYYVKLFSRLGSATKPKDKLSVLNDIKMAVAQDKPRIVSRPPSTGGFVLPDNDFKFPR